MCRDGATDDRMEVSTGDAQLSRPRPGTHDAYWERRRVASCCSDAFSAFSFHGRDVERDRLSRGKRGPALTALLLVHPSLAPPMPDTVAYRLLQEDTGRGAVSGGHLTDWRDRDQYRLRDTSHAGAARPSRGADGGTR